MGSTQEEAPSPRQSRFVVVLPLPGFVSAEKGASSFWVSPISQSSPHPLELQKSRQTRFLAHLTAQALPSFFSPFFFSPSLLRTRTDSSISNRLSRPPSPLPFAPLGIAQPHASPKTVERKEKGRLRYHPSPTPLTPPLPALFHVEQTILLCSHTRSPKNSPSVPCRPSPPSPSPNIGPPARGAPGATLPLCLLCTLISRHFALVSEKRGGARDPRHRFTMTRTQQTRAAQRKKVTKSKLCKMKKTPEARPPPG